MSLDISLFHTSTALKYNIMLTPWYALTQYCTLMSLDIQKIAPSHECLYLQVVQSEDPKQVRFKSNLFGSLGAGLFVGPNTIDFGTVFLNFDQKIIENAPVFFTILGIIILYIPLAIWCYRKDKADALKVI